MRRGLFITFEGSEGCGKSTQLRRLAAALEGAGRKVVLAREPGGTAVGDQIRHTLQYSAHSRNMVPEAELLLFAASRAQLVREIILPAIGDGKIVLCDRFHDSTTVYQGVARKLDPADVLLINGFAVNGCIPDITFLLDMDSTEALGRLLRRPRPLDTPDRMEQEPLAFYEAVRQGYLELAEREPGRLVLLDATQPEDALASTILSTLESRFHGLLTP